MCGGPWECNAGRFGPSLLYPCQELFSCLWLIQIYEVNVDDWPQQPFDNALLDAYREHLPQLPCGVMSEGCSPFCKGIIGSQVGRGEHWNSAFRTFGGLIHFCDKVRPWTHVPGLNDRGIVSNFKLEGDPFCPAAIRFVITDEKVFALICYHWRFILSSVTT